VGDSNKCKNFTLFTLFLEMKPCVFVKNVVLKTELHEGMGMVSFSFPALGKEKI
jgi:hypothetical protein